MDDKQTIEAKIAQLKTKLTGNLLQDGDVQQQIYELKKQRQPAIEDQPDEDVDDGCLYCGS